MKWLQVISGTRRFSSWPNTKFVMTVKWFLGVHQYSQEFYCDCGNTIEVFSDHTIMYKSDGDRIVCHNHFRDRYFEVCRDVEWGPIKKKKFGRDKVRPGDVFMSHFRGRKDVYVDWYVMHPVQSSYCQAAGLQKSQVAFKYEKRKFVKYKPWFRDARDITKLAPVALETTYNLILYCVDFEIFFFTVYNQYK
eukprot:TRINITY_DN4678_c1_g1_i1.p2 TRINITY_DN4678_c1_g1~~TRINITY_DN4678_c1_g1_i1.p2  ORF type:complete len:192 (+),score=16.57 TRINITY_DN4678_c1_g1_i1:2047-2622(+)